MTAEQITTFLNEESEKALKKYKIAKGINGHFLMATVYQQILEAMKGDTDVDSIYDAVVGIQLNYDIDYREFLLENPGKVMHNAAIKSDACERVLKFIKK